MKERQVTVLPDGLRAWRAERGFSQADLAVRADCSETLIALIETGKRQPGLGNAIAIARALSVKLTAFAIVHVDVEGLTSTNEEAVA